MRGFSMRNITFMIVIALLLWCCTMETCNARQGKHWRKRGSITASLSKKKPKNNHHGNAGKGKKKPPTPTPTPTPTPPTPTPQPPVVPPPAATPVPAIPVTPSPYIPVPGSTTVFNVLNFGAKGDGKTDDTKAFQAAWASACKTEASTIMVPSNYVFLVGPISFSGPYCQHNIVFQLEGKIVAPTNPKPWGSGILQWLEFTKLVGITVQGGGVIDGNGAVWWQNTPYDDESELAVPLSGNITNMNPPTPISESLGLGTKMPSIKPTALRFYGSFNVTVTGITIQNSQQCHLKFDNCIGVSVYNFTVSSPGDSPNTDGIHLQNTRDVLIRSSNLGCGDDCVSVQTGCTNVYVHDVNCGPGHGISIGGLGKDNTKACVSNITVRNVIMQNTMYGARIKTWQGGSGSVQGIHFSNIQVSEVQSPVMIDQFYCDKKSCKNQTSAVALTGIHFEKIRGTYTVTPVHLACSDSMPCTDVTLTDFELKPVQKAYHMYDPYCWQSYGELYAPTIPPVYCLQGGKPSSTTQGDDDSC